MELGVLFSMPKGKMGNRDEMRAGKCQLNECNQFALSQQPPQHVHSYLTAPRPCPHQSVLNNKINEFISPNETGISELPTPPNPRQVGVLLTPHDIYATTPSLS